MKIQGDRPSGVNEAGQTHQAERAQDGRAPQGSAPAHDADRVQVSADARLLGAAVNAAEKAPAIREDVVARAQARLAAGEIGNDPARLADRIIDGLLKA